MKRNITKQLQRVRGSV